MNPRKFAKGKLLSEPVSLYPLGVTKTLRGVRGFEQSELVSLYPFGIFFLKGKFSALYKV